MNRILFTTLLLGGLGLGAGGCCLFDVNSNSGNTEEQIYCEENPQFCEGEVQAGPEEAVRADSPINGAVDPSSEQR